MTEDIDRARELQDKQAKDQLLNQQHNHNLRSAHEEIEREKAVYLERLMESGMSDAGIQLLDNMVDQSFILGNISEAEYHDIKWQMHSLYLKIKSNFPQQETCVTGDLRAFVMDDESEALEPLTGKQKVVIAEMIRGIMLLISRSKEGFQQEMLVKSITVSEVMEPEREEDDSTIFGLFS